MLKAKNVFFMDTVSNISNDKVSNGLFTENTDSENRVVKKNKKPSDVNINVRWFLYYIIFSQILAFLSQVTHNHSLYQEQQDHLQSEQNCCPEAQSESQSLTDIRAAQTELAWVLFLF